MFSEVNRVMPCQGKCFPGGWLEARVCGPSAPPPGHTSAKGDITLFPVTLFPLISRLVGATTFLEMS